MIVARLPFTSAYLQGMAQSIRTDAQSSHAANLRPPARRA
jgi:hypothetical protein